MNGTDLLNILRNVFLLSDHLEMKKSHSNRTEGKKLNRMSPVCVPIILRDILLTDVHWNLRKDWAADVGDTVFFASHDLKNIVFPSLSLYSYWPAFKFYLFYIPQDIIVILYMHYLFIFTHRLIFPLFFSPSISWIILNHFLSELPVAINFLFLLVWKYLFHLHLLKGNFLSYRMLCAIAFHSLISDWLKK